MAAWTRLILLCVAIAAGAALPTAARAEQRIALVIGNSGYAKAPLRNPENDARLVAGKLRQFGFEVMEQRNLGQKEMKRAVTSFAERIRNAKGDAVALLFYAGHGLQIQNTNYVVPVDADIQSESDIVVDAVKLEEIVTLIADAQPRTTILILDACRDNPFARSVRSLHRGLAEMKARPGTLIAYSTAPGDTAKDGDGDNSPYSAALAEAMGEPGTDIEHVFKRVRVSVHESTNGQQTPWESSSLTSDFHFVQDGIKQATRPQNPMPAGPEQPADPEKAYRDALAANTLEAYEALLRRFPSHPRREAIDKLIARASDQRMWERVRRQDTILAYEQYKLAFPDGIYIEDADRRIDVLRDRSEEAEPAQPVKPAPSSAAAERRIRRRPGIDLFGGDYRIVKGVEQDACEQVCRSEARCRAFTYNIAANWCFLKERAGGEQPHADAYSAILGEEAAATGGNRLTADVQYGIDLPGGDYRVLRGGTLPGCEEACTGDRRCRAFTFNTRANVCFLKDFAGREERHPDAVSAVIRESVGTVSGAAAPQSRIARVEVFPHTDFPGNDYKDIRWISLETCRNSCGVDGRCRAFAYHVEKQWCFLKTGTGTRALNSATYGGVKN